MGERPLLWSARHRRHDGLTYCGIDEDDKDFFLIAKKNRVAAATRSYRANTNLDNWLTHRTSSACLINFRLPCRISVQNRRLINPRKRHKPSALKATPTR